MISGIALLALGVLGLLAVALYLRAGGDDGAFVFVMVLISAAAILSGSDRLDQALGTNGPPEQVQPAP